MQQQSSVYAGKLRFLYNGLIIIAAVVLFSILISIAGSNTILDARARPTVQTAESTITDTPNNVTLALFAFAGESRQLLLTIGRSVYSASQSVTHASSQLGGGLVHVSSVIASGAWDAISFIGRGIGSGVAFIFRVPGNVVNGVSDTKVVSSVIRPEQETKTPVITAQTSAAVFAHYDKRQQAEIAKLLEGQVLANRELGGSIVSGDPNRGGYPAQWDTVAQDSLVDSWGMYNRECVSYAAWKVYQTYGNMPYWGGIGNANQWPGNARNAGIPTSSIPKVKSVAISMHGYYGHAMWVEKIEGDMIYVGQYNYDLNGQYSEMWVNANEFTYLYFQ